MDRPDFSFVNRKRNKEAIALFDRLAGKYEYVGSGTYRAVFKLRGDFVLKIPLNEGGEYCNDGEGSFRAKELAKGRWLNVDGFICVIQERIAEASLRDIKTVFGRIPEWVAAIDSSQVGFNKMGQLKAFDFVHP